MEGQFQIVRLEAGPVSNSVTFSTLGLSNWPLKAPVSSKLIRHELVMLARNDSVPGNLPAILQQLAEEAIAQQAAYRRGDVVGPRGSLFDRSQLEAIYASNPVYFPSEFASVATETIGQVIFAWLVPITSREAAYVAANGWSSFEDRLVEAQPDLLDFHRLSTV
jgi:hypothetical protein